MEIPLQNQLRKELKEAGFGFELINQMGVELSYRTLMNEKFPGILNQMSSLRCDSDSQDSIGAIEDIKDIFREI